MKQALEISYVCLLVNPGHTIWLIHAKPHSDTNLNSSIDNSWLWYLQWDMSTITLVMCHVWLVTIHSSTFYIKIAWRYRYQWTCTDLLRICVTAHISKHTQKRMARMSLSICNQMFNVPAYNAIYKKSQCWNATQQFNWNGSLRDNDFWGIEHHHYTHSMIMRVRYLSNGILKGTMRKCVTRGWKTMR